MHSLLHSERNQMVTLQGKPFTFKFSPKLRTKIGLQITSFFESEDAFYEERRASVEGYAKALRFKHGLEYLATGKGSYSRYDNVFGEVHWYLLYGKQSDDEYGDCIELALQYAWPLALLTKDSRLLASFDTLTKAVNQYLLLDGVGYTVNSALQLVRVDSDALQTQVIEPALLITREAGYSGANDDFSLALINLRNKQYKAAVTDARRALESTLKAIARAKSWTLPSGEPLTGKETLAPLLALAFTTGLVSSSLQASFNGLRPFLQSTVPSVANPAAHGSADVFEIPAEIAEFAVVSAGAAISLLTKLARY